MGPEGFRSGAAAVAVGGARLTLLLADEMLDNAMLKEISAKNVWSAPRSQELSAI
ncbi:hypothetical protein EBBID32_37020 [Sphingobium indicum BiD32]|uniref:Uncharacterized protein n=1 Tax=Sphingobium indicum BiD32 TaxID=1301087 RepID=N1MQW8_9SPHN|nr:hypothetical protein EBBID32_37020 [Sphingobium indicum BiD32]